MPKVGKAGRMFDSANHELEKKRKAQESEGSDREEKKPWSLYFIIITNYGYPACNWSRSVSLQNLPHRLNRPDKFLWKEGKTQKITLKNKRCLYG